MPTKKKSAPPAQQARTPLQTYGLKLPPLPPGVNAQLMYDMEAFARRVPIERGAPPRHILFRQIANVLVPGWFEWHDWTDKVVKGLCYNTWSAYSGCHNSAKTRNIVGFACLWWLCDPLHSSVTLTSTTVKALRKRGWSEVQSFYSSIPGNRIGNMIDSRMLWQAKKGDDKLTVFGRAVEEGALNKVADDIKGVHTMRQMIIIDEATAVPPAIFEACTNLYSYPREFVLAMIGNPRSRLDEFGKFCEPIGGWDSVSVEDDEWETGPKLNGVNGVVIRFDAEKSPNITEGRIVSKHLPTAEKVAARKKSPGFENDPSYWSNDRGFWAPDGLLKTVFSETAIMTFHGGDKHKFTGNKFMIVGALDPAREGDRPSLRFGGFGEIEGGKMGLELGPPSTVTINAKSKLPIDYQIVAAVKRGCENVTWRGVAGYKCLPEHFGVDATGGGADLCDIFQQEWSPNILRIQFGGSASTDACSYEDLRPANERYGNKRAEMYVRARKAMESGQLKGIDVETAKELCSVEADESKSANSNRGLIVLMSKKEYKAKYKKSPDEADSAIIELEVCKRLGFRLAPMGQSITKHEAFEEQVEKAQAVFEQVDYGAGNEELAVEEVEYFF